MSKSYDLSIVIPAYQESENLVLILPRLHITLEKLHLSYEVLIVDTMEPIDNTKDICAANKVTYINRMGGNQYGDAIRTAIQVAQGTKIIFMDADGSHDPEFIAELYQYKDTHDIIIASRYVEGGGIDNAWHLVLMSKILNLSYALLLQINCKDLSNSYKLYDAKQLKALTLYCSNFDIIEEIIYKLSKNNKPLKIKEIPYVFKKRIFGETKRNLFLFICSYVGTMIKLRLGK